MNYDVTVLTTLCCRVLTLVCCLPVHGRSGWHLVAQHTDLALGCPTYSLVHDRLRSGTWLPNSTVRHTVAQHFDMVPGRHMGAQHMFRSTWLYLSFDLAGQASFWLWYYVTSTISTTSFVIRWLHVMHYGHFLCRVNDPAELCIYFLHINLQHSMLINLPLFLYVHCYCLAVSLWAHLLIRTSSYSIPRLHPLYVIGQYHIPCHDVQYYLLTF